MLNRLRDVMHLWWAMTRLTIQVLYGGWKVSGLSRPVVSIFGGASLPQTDPYAYKAHELAALLVEADISVLTGGGPGIMEAASCGAIPKKGGKGRSIGIGVTDLDEGKNKCVQEYIMLDYFFARKWLLIRYAQAVVVFPGGYGTLDELTEILTLVQLKRYKQLPIILFGTEYWTPFITWITDEVFKHHSLIKPQDKDLFIMTDDITVAFEAVRSVMGNNEESPKNPL